LERLKKTVQTQEVGRELVKLVNAEISKKKPSAKLGNAVISTAVWFRDSNEVAKAEELLQLGLKLQQEALKLATPPLNDSISLRIGYVERALGQLGSARLRLLSLVPTAEPGDLLRN
jgi:hypothetical protein